MQVQDKQAKKTFTVMIEAVMIEPSRLRLDVNGPFGTVLGKLVMKEDRVGVLLPRQKKAYVGLVSEKSLRPLLPVQINPRDLLQFLLGDTPKDWKCEQTTTGLQECKSLKQALILRRDPRPESKKAKWSIDGDTFGIVFLPTSSTTNVQPSPEAFSLVIPEGYSKHKLP